MKPESTLTEDIISIYLEVNESLRSNYSDVTRLEEEHMTPVQLQGLDAELSHDVMFDAEPPTAVLILRSAWAVIGVSDRFDLN